MFAIANCLQMHEAGHAWSIIISISTMYEYLDRATYCIKTHAVSNCRDLAMTSHLCTRQRTTSVIMIKH